MVREAKVRNGTARRWAGPFAVHEKENRTCGGDRSACCNHRRAAIRNRPPVAVRWIVDVAPGGRGVDRFELFGTREIREYAGNAQRDARSGSHHSGETLGRRGIRRWNRVLRNWLWRRHRWSQRARRCWGRCLRRWRIVSVGGQLDGRGRASCYGHCLQRWRPARNGDANLRNARVGPDTAIRRNGGRRFALEYRDLRSRDGAAQFYSPQSRPCAVPCFFEPRSVLVDPGVRCGKSFRQVRLGQPKPLERLFDET